MELENIITQHDHKNCHDHDDYVQATAAAAVGKMELARTHGTEIPEGWALDKWAAYKQQHHDCHHDCHHDGHHLHFIIEDNVKGYQSPELALLFE